MHALDMLLSIGRHVADDIKLDRLVPYIVSCLHDEVGIVRAHALKTLAKVVRSDCVVDKKAALQTITRPNLMAHSGHRSWMRLNPST